MYVCIPGFNGTWKQLECRHVRRFACKEERAKCNLDYHSNEDLCTASAYASGCDSLENCLRCWYWKFMRITSTGDAEVTARARASPRPKPFVADENYTLETAWPLLSMTPPLNIYIYIFFSRFISLLLYRWEKNILFLPNVETFEKKNKFCWFAFTRTIFSHFFPFNIYSLSQLCHYIVCSNALRSVCVSHRECVWFISFYSVYLLHFFPLFLRGTGCAGEEVSIVFLRVESLLLVTTSKEVCCRHGLQENFPRFFFPSNFDPPFEEREKEPRFTSSRTSALPLIRVSGKRSFWVY